MNSFLGIDTSNYTTSASIYSNGKIIKNIKKLLPVKDGSLGLRQSDAVFMHVNAISEVLSKLLEDVDINVKAVGVSVKPRDQEGSYMPCFNVGASTASVISSFLKVPLYGLSHQAGHIVAALYSAGKLSLLKEKFLSFHVSGGTTEAILVEPDSNKVLKTSIVARTLDLNAGQLIDRVGKMLNLKFPSGPELEKLALKYEGKIITRPTLKGSDCCLSGVENICAKMKVSGETDSKIAKYCIEHILNTLDFMCGNLLKQYGNIPVLFAGGVMSNFRINEFLSKKYNAYFALPEFSSDNAAGVAILASEFYMIENGDLK